MENKNQNIVAETLRNWLDEKEPVIVLDVRPKEQREEWFIPGSIYLDAYKRLNEGDFSVLDEINLPENTKVITVCAAGRTSQIASNELRKKGIEAYSLEGGMKAWSLAWNTARLDFPDMGFEVIQVRRTGKGCLSYIISSQGSAIILDPSLDIEIYEKLLSDNKLQLKYVLETHTHADHLSRARLLAEKFNAKLALPSSSKVAFSFTPVSNGDILKLSTISLKAISTPGHTYDSTSYLINDIVLFTGDTLFTNSIGRPDLKSSEEEAKIKSKALYASLKELIQLKYDIIILPGHTSKPVDFNNVMIQSTIGEAKQTIDLLKLEEKEFIKEILSRIPPTPSNYLEIVEHNIIGERIINPELEAGANRCAIS